MAGLHPSHKTRVAMGASSYDEICENCGATDITGGGWGKLAEPCPALADPLWGLRNAKYLNPACGLNGCQWLQVRLELLNIASWIRTPGNINRDDAIDECARVLENRAAALAGERTPKDESIPDPPDSLWAHVTDPPYDPTDPRR